MLKRNTKLSLFFCFVNKKNYVKLFFVIVIVLHEIVISLICLPGERRWQNRPLLTCLSLPVRLDPEPVWSDSTETTRSRSDTSPEENFPENKDSYFKVEWLRNSVKVNCLPRKIAIKVNSHLRWLTDPLARPWLKVWKLNRSNLQKKSQEKKFENVTCFWHCWFF